MPNHVRTKVYFDGDPEDICAMLENIRGDENYPCIDFNRIIPMPEELRETEARVGEPSEKQKANLKKYGYKDWYGWACDNWGTKWNAYEQEPGEDCLSFWTAWSFPEPVLRELSQQYPNIGVYCEFADEDYGSNCGTAEFIAGNGSVAYCDGDIGFAAEVWGTVPEELGYRQEDDGTWVYDESLLEW